jgi:hypothetical protein
MKAADSSTEEPRERRRSRRSRRPEDEAEARPTSPGSDEPWVKPIPEEEWMARKKEIEAASVTQESFEEKPARNEPESTAKPEDTGDRSSRPRRRRTRRAGTPTRLIGTGKTSDDD